MIEVSDTDTRRVSPPTYLSTQSLGVAITEDSTQITKDYMLGFCGRKRDMWELFLLCFSFFYFFYYSHFTSQSSWYIQIVKQYNTEVV
jgi:hypothetical protein